MKKLSLLPKIDKIQVHEKLAGLNQKRVAKIARIVVEKYRQNLKNSQIQSFAEDDIIDEILTNYNQSLSNSLIPLINATGIIAHTNLGRSLIDEQIYENAKNIICHYSNLEYDLNAGKRGQRYSHLCKFTKELFGFEDALVVNNNAAAVFLVLNTFSKGKKTIVSRGELIEIGGSFRVPEVMNESGAVLKEVGTTNKTHLKDYEKNISKNTAVIMKVHQSNFDIVGFSKSTDIESLAKLAKERKLLSYYDLGSGFSGSLPYNLDKNEHSIENLAKSGVDLVSFSGDKLFGSVQAGVILGKTKLIEQLKQNQLLRMLRVDKINLSLLQESLKAYIEEKLELIPTIKLLNRSENELFSLANKFQKLINSEVIKTKTYIGGGSLPNKKFPSIALYIKGNAKKLEKIFRENGVIGRIENDKFLLDFRSINDNDEANLKQILTNLGNTLG